MDKAKLKDLLDAVAAGSLSPDDAVKRLRALPFEDLGFAKLDHHRPLRKGYPETVFCAGKAPEQVVEIASRMREHGSNVLLTRCSADTAAAVLAAHPDAVHHEAARAVTITVTPPPALSGYVAVVCAGTSDIPVAEEAVVTAESLGNAVERIYDVGVAGLHRLLGQREKLEGANALVVCAGMEGALPSVVAGLVDKPVIAVPTSIGYGASFGGIAPLLAMLNSCASGVAVVNIDNGFGAGVLAGMINRVANGT
ncbi:MAG: nickel pincer cofactor biosynthesis protein LarB [Candidatus Hydrogenedentes bacterium]|nr:nickel pincer cofactor biosynthesis protein LarB [Candidatus Hydrogenedentota bacterium]